MLYVFTIGVNAVMTALAAAFYAFVTEARRCPGSTNAVAGLALIIRRYMELGFTLGRIVVVATDTALCDAGVIHPGGGAEIGWEMAVVATIAGGDVSERFTHCHDTIVAAITMLRGAAKYPIDVAGLAGNLLVSSGQWKTCGQVAEIFRDIVCVRTVQRVAKADQDER